MNNRLPSEYSKSDHSEGTDPQELIGPTHLSLFNHYKPLLFSIAYRMLGSVADAEDKLQETFIRASRSGSFRRSRRIHLPM